MTPKAKEPDTPVADQPVAGRLHFPQLRIQGFRGFDDLSASGLGRVTLITGKNNTGKSSILEALRLYAHKGALPVIFDILDSREELIDEEQVNEHSSSSDKVFQVSTLFHDFPRLMDKAAPIVISTGSNASPEELSIRFGWFVEEEDLEGFTRLVPIQASLLSEDYEFVAALSVETKESRMTHRVERLSRRSYLRGSIDRRFRDVMSISCSFVSPYSGQQTDTVAYLWDKIALTPNEEEIVKALRIVEPRISGVSVIGSEGRSSKRRAIVRTENLLHPLPLRSFGDGVNRLFALALSLIDARDGILLIDEFENGIHYTVMPDVWGMIFRLAKELNVQVFATTYSSDTVKFFKEVAAESPEDAALLRLKRIRDKIVPTVFSKDEIAIANRARIDLR